MPKPGWLERQFRLAEADFETWPEWMKRESGHPTELPLHKLFKKLAEGGKVETEKEQTILHVLAARLSNPPPKNACPYCWFQRILDGKE